MPVLIEVNDATRETVIQALRAHRARAAALPPASLRPRYVSDIDQTIDDLITGRCKLVTGSDEAYRALGLIAETPRVPAAPHHPPTRQGER